MLTVNDRDTFDNTPARHMGRPTRAAKVHASRRSPVASARRAASRSASTSSSRGASRKSAQCSRRSGRSAIRVSLTSRSPWIRRSTTAWPRRRSAGHAVPYCADGTNQHPEARAARFAAGWPGWCRLMERFRLRVRTSRSVATSGSCTCSPTTRAIGSARAMPACSAPASAPASRARLRQLADPFLDGPKRPSRSQPRSSAPVSGAPLAASEDGMRLALSILGSALPADGAPAADVQPRPRRAAVRGRALLVHPLLLWLSTGRRACSGPGLLTHEEPDTDQSIAGNQARTRGGRQDRHRRQPRGVTSSLHLEDPEQSPATAKTEAGDGSDNQGGSAAVPGGRPACASLPAESQRDNNALRPPQNRLIFGGHAERQPSPGPQSGGLLFTMSTLTRRILPPAVDEPSASDLKYLPPKLQQLRLFFERLLDGRNPPSCRERRRVFLRSPGVLGDADRVKAKTGAAEGANNGANIMLGSVWGCRHERAFALSPSDELLSSLQRSIRDTLGPSRTDPIIVADPQLGAVPSSGGRQVRLKAVYSNDLNPVAVIICAAFGLSSSLRTEASPTDRRVREADRCQCQEASRPILPARVARDLVVREEAARAVRVAISGYCVQR